MRTKMKKLILTLVTSLLMTGTAMADILDFEWGYTSEAAALIDGFRLYQDGQRVDLVIPPDARTVSVPQIIDFNSHTYFLTAYSGNMESVPSDTATAPAYFDGVPPVDEGTFIITIRRVNR